jgi:hypothetical protein
MEAQEVVTSDEQRLGHVVAERDDCVIVEMGHVFKSKHAIPRQFVHEHDGVLRATVTKDVVADSPKVDLEHWDARAIRLHYGVEATFEVDPDPDGIESAETDALRAGLEPTPKQRVHTASGESGDPAYDKPAVHERQANAADPAGTTANLD